MDAALELMERCYCELPHKDGHRQCMNPTAEILTLLSHYTVAVCAECAAYVRKDAKANVCRNAK